MKERKRDWMNMVLIPPSRINHHNTFPPLPLCSVSKIKDSREKIKRFTAKHSKNFSGRIFFRKLIYARWRKLDLLPRRRLVQREFFSIHFLSEVPSHSAFLWRRKKQLPKENHPRVKCSNTADYCQFPAIFFLTSSLRYFFIGIRETGSVFKFVFFWCLRTTLSGRCSWNERVLKYLCVYWAPNTHKRASHGLFHQRDHLHRDPRSEMKTAPVFPFCEWF